ncbi:MAG: hypothetical protein ACR2O8_08745 [Rhizobiaceae bacterium]
MHSTTPCGAVRPFLRRALLSTTIIAGMASLAIPAAFGQTLEWTGNASQDWFNANNWNPVEAPDATTDVLINTIAMKH